MSGPALIFESSIGKFYCEVTRGTDRSLASAASFIPNFGFPSGVYCEMYESPPSCVDIAGATFSGGGATEELKGMNVFPRAVPKGWKLGGDPSKIDATSELFELDAPPPQYGISEIEGTGAATTDDFLTKQVEFTWPGNYQTGDYKTTNWTPGALVLSQKQSHVYVYWPRVNGHTGAGEGFLMAGSRHYPIESVEFCFSNDGGSQEQKQPVASSGGDPHFKTWSGQKFDFHGGCDLVLLENARFNDGLGLDVHIRTKIEGTWSYIDTAAVRLGDHTLEIAGGLSEIPYWLDGNKTANMETGDATLGDYATHFRRINDHQSQTRLDLGHGNALSIETFKRFVRVNIKTASPEYFAGTYGMLGSYPGGEKVGRDTTTVIEDVNEFGQEWQVLADEAKLFHEESNVQPPMKCVMPDTTKKSQSRRLGEATVSEEDAALACARVSEEDRDACIFDVMATNDKDMAGSY